MRKLTSPNRGSSRLSKVGGRLVLAGCAVLAPASAEPSNGEICPTNFQCNSRMEVLVATGMQHSHSFRSLLETLGSHPEVSLELKFSRQRSGVRAQSDLKVMFVYLTENGGQRRQNYGVSGRVTVPYVTYAHRQIALIAHELAHVLIRLRGGAPMARAEEEQLALDVEAMVLAELGVLERITR